MNSVIPKRAIWYSFENWQLPYIYIYFKPVTVLIAIVLLPNIKTVVYKSEINITELTTERAYLHDRYLLFLIFTF